MGSPDVPSPLTCEAPGPGGELCGRAFRARAKVDGRELALCATHYQQARRDRGLTPIGQGRSVKNRLPGVLVSDACVTELRRLGPSLYQAARQVLETWAGRMQTIRSKKP